MRKFGNKQSTPIILEMPIMPIMPPRGIDRSNFSDGSDRSEKGLEDSEDNGEIQKKVKRSFGEKRL